jgi:hypothetical protein
MPKYHVHLYPIVCVTVRDVEAESQVDAIKKAEDLVDLDRLFAGLGGPHVASIQYADGLDGFLVDEDGDTEHERSTCFDMEYEPI